MPRFMIAKFAIPIAIATLVSTAFLSTSPTTVSGQTATETSTATATVTGTATGTATATVTGTATGTATATVTGTATGTATATVTGTATGTATATATTVPGNGQITSGTVSQNGFSLIVWGGGSRAQLVTAANCTAPTLAFWATSNGEFVTYVPGTTISAVNATFITLYPNGVPAATPLIVRCN